MTQHLCGENAVMSNETYTGIAEKYQSDIGCGKETAVLEGHTWGYGEWYDDDYDNIDASTYLKELCLKGLRIVCND